MPKLQLGQVRISQDDTNASCITKPLVWSIYVISPESDASLTETASDVVPRISRLYVLWFVLIIHGLDCADPMWRFVVVTVRSTSH